MRNKRNIVLLWGVSLAPALILAAVYQRLPETVPTSFGLDGTINAYGPRYTLWVMAGMAPLFAALFQFMPKMDPKKRNYEKFQKYYDIFAIFMELFLLGINSLMLVEILQPGIVSIGRAVTVLACLLLILIGNMMGKIKNNFFFGIRTPWTISDPDVWNRTHRLGGRIWFAAGVLLLPCCLFLPERIFFWLLMAGVLAASAVPAFFSYWWYRQKNRNE